MRTRSPGVQRLRAAEELLVEVGAVGGAEVLDHHHAALADDLRVARRGERVLQADLGLVAAAQHRALAEVVLHARRVAGRALDDQARLAPGLRGRPRCAGRSPPRADRRRPTASGPTVPGTRRRSFIALRETHSRNRNSTARKPNFSATEAGSSAATISRPRSARRRCRASMWSPGCSGLRLADRDVAAVDPHAVGRAEVGDRPRPCAPGGSRRACARRWSRPGRCRTRGCGRSWRRPGRRVALALGHQHRAARARCALLLQRRLDAVGRRVDHRVPVVGLLGVVPSPSLTVRAWMPNSPSASCSSVRNSICGPRDQRQRLAARVLEQVGAELVDDLLLDALVALAVLGREPDDVLVGHVGARDRDGAVLVHLLGELARELDRADLGAEDAAERPLDEAGDLVFEVAQDGHGESAMLRRQVRLSAPDEHGRQGAPARRRRRGRAGHRRRGLRHRPRAQRQRGRPGDAPSEVDADVAAADEARAAAAAAARPDGGDGEVGPATAAAQRSRGGPSDQALVRESAATREIHQYAGAPRTARARGPRACPASAGQARGTPSEPRPTATPGQPTTTRARRGASSGSGRGGEAEDHQPSAALRRPASRSARRGAGQPAQARQQRDESRRPARPTAPGRGAGGRSTRERRPRCNAAPVRQTGCQARGDGDADARRSGARAQVAHRAGADRERARAAWLLARRRATGRVDPAPVSLAFGGPAGGPRRSRARRRRRGGRRRGRGAAVHEPRCPGSGRTPRVDGRAEVERQVAAQAPQRRQPHADPAGGRGRVGAAHRVDAATAPRRGRAPARRGRTRRVGAAALGLLGRHVGQRADDVAGRVSASSPAIRAMPKSVSLATPPSARGLGDEDVAGLDVAVDDPARVGVGQRVAQRHADQQRRRGPTARLLAAARASVAPRTSSETR